MMEPNHRRSNKKQTIITEMHELSQCSDTNFVTTRTQGHVTGTKGMGIHKVTDSQVSLKIKHYKILSNLTSFHKVNSLSEV